MRNISFQMTTDQILGRTKTVTRRLGWLTLKPGDMLRACEKCMGLKPGEKVRQLAVIRITSVRRERLEEITAEDCALEGFPDMMPEEFVAMFCRHMKVTPDTPVTRIEFEYS